MAGRWLSPPATPTYVNCSPTPAILTRQLPWLLLPQGNGERSSTNNRLSFLEVITDNHRQVGLSEPFTTTWRCRGSSHGWLVILDESPNVILLNPSTGAKLSPLPPLSALTPVTRFDASRVGREYDFHPRYGETGVPSSTMRDKFIKKIILSDCPSRNPNFTALAILDSNGKGIGNLACCKSGQDRWTLVPGTDVEDAVYFGEKVYTVTSSGRIYTCDVSCDSPNIEKMAITGSIHGHALYLVSAGDELLLVSRNFNDDESDDQEYKTGGFEVFKLSSCESGKKWERVHDLGDGALFLGGCSCSSALRASEFPGCPGNSIHYTEDDCLEELFGRPDEHELHDMGVFCLDKNRCYQFPCDCYERVVPSAYPTWLTPKS